MLELGEGWRELGPDELLESGDETELPDVWALVADHTIGQSVREIASRYDGVRYRRRVMPDVILRDDKGQPSTVWKQSEGVVAIDPGEGWRLLDPDEYIRAGDGIWSRGSWRLADDHAGDRASDFGQTFRRRIDVGHVHRASGEGRKDDAGKLRYDLLPVEPLREVVRVLTHGARHYAPNNWQLVPEWKWRYTRAAMSHIEKWRGGETNDAESGWGTHHLAHAVCCLLFLLWFELTAKPANMAGDEDMSPPEADEKKTTGDLYYWALDEITALQKRVFELEEGDVSGAFVRMDEAIDVLTARLNAMGAPNISSDSRLRSMLVDLVKEERKWSDGTGDRAVLVGKIDSILSLTAPADLPDLRREMETIAADAIKNLRQPESLRLAALEAWVKEQRERLIGSPDSYEKGELDAIDQVAGILGLA